MRSRYFTWAVSAIFCTTVAPLLPAQKPTPTPARGYIRFWNMLPPASGKFDLRKIGAASAAATLSSNATSYRASNYTALAPGSYRLGVYKASDDKSPLKVFDVNLMPNIFFTVLVSPGKIDLVNDTVDPKATTGTATVRNFFPDATVTVSSGAGVLASALPYGQSYTATALPLTRSVLTMSGHLPTGTPVQASVEIDFAPSKRATVLIIPDSYGRFRPRITVDGKDI